MSLAEDQIERKEENHPFDVLSARIGKLKNPSIAAAIDTIQRFHEEIQNGKEKLANNEETKAIEEKPINQKALLDGIKEEMEK